MTERPDFRVLLARLHQHRELDVATLSQAASVPEPELQAVLDGAMPTSSLLRRVAPAFHLHSADLFVMAGLPVPEDLGPLDAKASSTVHGLVRLAIRLDAERRQELRQYAQTLPQQDRDEHVPMLPAYEEYEPSFGAMIVRMLRNRNLDWSSSAKILFRLTGVGPLSASTIGAIGHGRKELSPELLVGFATVLAIPADDLAAVVGIGLSDAVPATNAVATDVAELIWDVRRLTVNQIQQVCAVAKRI